MTTLQPNLEISFSLYDINMFMHKQSFLVNQADASQLMNICEDMLMSLGNEAASDSDVLNRTITFESYYSMYQMPLTFDELSRIKKEQVVSHLSDFKTCLQSGELDSEKLSYFKYYLFLFYSIRIFKIHWYMDPKIFFSDSLYSTLDNDTNKLLFSHHLLDFTNDPCELPIFPAVNQNQADTEGWPLHYINSEKAKLILSKIHDLDFLNNPSYYNKETQIFKELLIQSIENKIYMTIERHD